jgi:NAD-dependent dihydropyrimidine dehydrogenase PreA subunit
MASTTVLIAVKPAMSAWRTKMKSDSARVVFHLDRDPLLVGVLRRAVEFQSQQAGLHTDTCHDFSKACEDVCREAISKFTDADGKLEVTVETFQDRIEIAIHHHGQLVPAIGLETFAIPDAPARESGGLNGLELLSRVDRVMYSTEGGSARTTLVKFLNSSRH